MKVRRLGTEVSGVLVAVAAAGLLSGGVASAEVGLTSTIAPEGAGSATAALMGEYADAAHLARHEIGIADNVHELTNVQFQEINKLVNSDGRFNSIGVSSSSTQAGDVTAAYYDPLGPGINQDAVCAANPIDCSRSVSARTDANNVSADRYPNLAGTDDLRDAMRHCVWQALTTKRANADFAAQLGDAHEADGNADGTGNPAANEMDQNNNAVGRQVGLENEDTPDSAIYDRCGFLADTGGLRTLI